MRAASAAPHLFDMRLAEERTPCRLGSAPADPDLHGVRSEPPMSRDARHIDEGQRQLPLICLSCIPSRGIESTAPRWHVPARKQENAGVGDGGAHTTNSSAAAHPTGMALFCPEPPALLPTAVCWPARAIATLVSGRTETETRFMEPQKNAKFHSLALKLTFENFRCQK